MSFFFFFFFCRRGAGGCPVFPDTSRVAPSSEQSPTYSEHLPNVEPESWSAALEGGEVEREGDDEGERRQHPSAFSPLNTIPTSSPTAARAPTRQIKGGWACGSFFYLTCVCLSYIRLVRDGLNSAVFSADAPVGCPGPGGELIRLCTYYCQNSGLRCEDMFNDLNAPGMTESRLHQMF